jgi:adenylate cyclase
VERRLAAILSADAKGYSRLMGDDEAATVRTITEYREVMRAAIVGARGRVVDATGDNLLAEFASVVEAVECAVAIQERLRERNAALPEARRMEFRIGINLGDVIADGERIYGDGVNVAARLEPLADGGGICVSGTVYDQIAGKLALAWDALGEQAVKNIARPVRVYRWRAAGDGAPASAAPPEPPPDRPSIAVLPFANLSGDPAQDYLGDGIAEDIVTDLSKLSGLLVIARQSAFAFKGRAVPVQQIARELGVRHVLEGSVRKAADRLRITVQLVDAATGLQRWAERYDRDVRDIFDVQDDITRRVVTELEVRLLRGEQARVWRRGTTSLEAYDALLRGVVAAHETTAVANAAARRFYEQAVALDPAFAQAWVLLAWTHWFDAWLGWTSERGAALERARQDALRATAIDPDQGDAYGVLGMVHLLEGRHDDALAATTRGVHLQPGGANVVLLHAAVLTFCGRPEEGATAVARAMRLMPVPTTPFLRVHAHALRNLGRYDESVAVFQQLRALEPESPLPLVGAAIALEEAGRHEEAVAAIQEARALDPALSLARCVSLYALYKDPADRARDVDALRRAGLT